MLRAAPSQVEAATRMPFRSMASAPASRSSWIRSSSISHETAPSWSSIEIATPGPSTGTSPDRTWRSSRVLRASWMAASSLLAEPSRPPPEPAKGTRRPAAPAAWVPRLWILAGGRIDGLRPPSQCSPRTGSSPPPSSLTEEVPPDRRQALEHPHAKHDNPPEQKVRGPQTVAEPHHEHRQQGVRQERHQQLALVVHALQAVADPLEHHVERGHHDHREVGGQADRELRPQDQPEDDTGDQRQQGDHGATSAAGRAQERPVAASRLGMRRASSARTEKPRPYSSVHTASCSAIEDRSSPRRSCSESPIAAIRYGDDSGRKLTWTRPPASRIAVMAATRRPFTATARLPADHRALTTSWMSTSWIRRSRTSPRVRGASSLSRSSTTSPGPSIGPTPAGGRSCSTRSRTPANSADPLALAACAEARRSPSSATSPESDWVAARRRSIRATRPLEPSGSRSRWTTAAVTRIPSTRRIDGRASLGRRPRVTPYSRSSSTRAANSAAIEREPSGSPASAHTRTTGSCGWGMTRAQSVPRNAFTPSIVTVSSPFRRSTRRRITVPFDSHGVATSTRTTLLGGRASTTSSSRCPTPASSSRSFTKLITASYAGRNSGNM